MIYLLDTNVFIQAHKQYYDFKFCPAFWDWLLVGCKNNILLSTHDVKNEINNGWDELKTWAENDGNILFGKNINNDEGISEALSSVAVWVSAQKHYKPHAVDAFFSSVDYKLIAHALARNYTMVSHEVTSNSSKKVKIPDVCKGLKIPYKTVFRMLSDCSAKFVLEN